MDESTLEMDIEAVVVPTNKSHEGDLKEVSCKVAVETEGLPVPRASPKDYLGETHVARNASFTAVIHRDDGVPTVLDSIVPTVHNKCHPTALEHYTPITIVDGTMPEDPDGYLAELEHTEANRDAIVV